MQSEFRTYLPIYGLLLLGFSLILSMVATMFIMIEMLKADEVISCEAEKKQLTTVANISNATGQLPDGTRLKVGQTVNVKPDYCK